MVLHFQRFLEDLDLSGLQYLGLFSSDTSFQDYDQLPRDTSFEPLTSWRHFRLMDRP